MFAALHNLLTTTSAFVKSPLLACLPHLVVLQYKIKYQLDVTLSILGAALTLVHQ